jgi:serine/threonine-protein kinase
LSDVTISEDRPDQLPLRPGDQLGGYSVVELVGSGGMGDVYRALDPELGRSVALKVIATHLASDDRFRRRFEREWRMMAALDHPNVVAVYRAGEEAGRLYMAMRFVDGQGLDALLAQRGPLAPQEAVAIVAEVAAGLDAAHAAGLVHRDVKPGNVLLAGDGRVFVTDFGLTVPAQRPTTLTSTGQFMGTVAYAAPEQIRGADLDARTDVYALGGVLHHCLTGQPPYGGTPLEAVAAHLTDTTPRPSRLAPVSEAFDQVIARAMAKNPADRYGTAGELARAAAAACTSHTSPRRRPRVPPKSWLVAGTLVAAVAIAVAVLTGSDQPGRPHKAPAAASAVGRPIALPSRPDNIVTLGGTVWTQTDIGGALVRIDGRTRSVAGLPAPVDLGGGQYSGLAAGAGSIWTAFEPKQVGGITRVDPATGTAVARVQLAEGASGVAVGEGAAWATAVPRHGPGRLVRIDLRTNRATRSFAVLGRSPAAIAPGAGAIWVADRSDGVLDRIDPRTGHRARIRIGGSPTALAVSDSVVWVLDSSTRTLLRVDPRRHEVVGAPVSLGKDLLDIVLSGSDLWVAAADATVTRLDARTGRPHGAPIAVDAPPLVLASDGTGVWVASGAKQTVRRLTARS